jgi:hypothetical protein
MALGKEEMGASGRKITSGFNRAADNLPETFFCKSLMQYFGRETMFRVVDAFQKMGLPLPEKEEEFLKGSVGALVFLNDYGVVIRMELSGGKRVNDSGWIVQPLATIDAGELLIEICPGCVQAQSAKNNAYLSHKLERQGLKFWDCKISNIGHIPVSSVRFPEGIPVVIDRLGVNKLTESAAAIRAALNDLPSREAAEAQEKLYAPLRAAFAAAWPEPGKMKDFWSLCQSYLREGKLVAGWNTPQGEEAAREETPFGSNIKTPLAAGAAKHYESRLKSPAVTFAQWLKTLPGKQP